MVIYYGCPLNGEQGPLGQPSGFVRVLSGGARCVRVGPAKFVAHLTEPFGLRLYRYGFWDASLSSLIQILREGDTFVDCGAHEGLFSVVAAARVGRCGSVIAFEPVPMLAERLEENVRINGFENVRIVGSALSDAEGRRKFVVAPSAAGTSSFVLDGGEEIIVDTTTLDVALERGEARLVKIDVEGAEVAVLRGARKLLSSDAAWIVEIEPAHLARHGATADELIQLLTASGRVSKPLSPPNYLFFRPAETLMT